jgi:flagellar biosynthesis/type III secretory pathway M-ring protein FliF/YscJ
MPQDFWFNALYSVAPTILIGLVFWFILRAIIRADRNERDARAKIEVEERARLARWSLENRDSDSATPAPTPASGVGSPESKVSRGV